MQGKLKENRARKLIGLTPYTPAFSMYKHRTDHLNHHQSEQRATNKAEHRDTFKAAHDIAKALSDATGEEWNIDHIIPLNNPSVCGLNTAANIEIVPTVLNRKKGNAFILD